uniref:Origin recognition complex subunit 1 n=1 Tax=Strongyloides papillosus TaxID=174720 RepID=A0A0N5CGN1_STREA
MSDNEKILSIGNELLANKKDIVKKKRGRPPTKFNNDGIKKYKKNNLPQNYLSFGKNNKNENLKIIKCSKSTTNICKKLPISKIQMNNEKKKRGRPRKNLSSTIDIKSPPKLEESILSLIAKKDTESDDELFIEDIECKTETTLEAQNKLLNLLQKPPAFSDFTISNKIDDNIKQHGKKRGRPRKSDIQSPINGKSSKFTGNGLSEVKNNSPTNKQKEKYSNDKRTSLLNFENSPKDKSTRKRRKVSTDKSSSTMPFNITENSILTNSNSETLNINHSNTNLSGNASLSMTSEHLKSKNEKLNSKLSYNEPTKDSTLHQSQSDTTSHSTERTLSNLFKSEAIIPQIIVKKKRGRPRGSLTSKSKSNDSLLIPSNNDNFMEKILGSFSNDVTVKKKRGRPCKINLSNVKTDNILPTIDNGDQNSINLNHLKLQKLVHQRIENLSKISRSQDLLISKEKDTHGEGENNTFTGEISSNSQNLNSSDLGTIYNKKVDLQNGGVNMDDEEKKSLSESTVIVTLSSDGTYSIGGNLPKAPKILICSGVIENTNDGIKVPIQLVINNQSGNSNSDMTPITLSPENLSRSESLPYGSDSNQVNDSSTSIRNNSFSSNVENQSNGTIKKSTSNSFFDNQRDALSTKLIHNESILSPDEGSNINRCKPKNNIISSTSISGLDKEEYNDNESGIFKPFMPKSVLPIKITSLRDGSIYDTKSRARASSLPPFGSPK